MRKKIGIFCMIIGTVFVAAALSLLVYNWHEDRRADHASHEVLQKLQTEIPDNGLSDNKQTSDNDMKVVFIDNYGYIGYLSIPALNLELPVMSEWDYPRLTIAPCRYFGSVKSDDLVIAAHNYTKHFGRLSKLREDDMVFFTDMEGITHAYKVKMIELLAPDEIEKMIASDWDLSLYTCTYGAQRRVTVRCERTEYQIGRNNLN